MARFAALAVLVLTLGACAQDPTSCSSGYFSCGDPAGGPKCCPTGDSCCFGHNLCCVETKPHLGRSRTTGALGCYASLSGEGTTWDLVTVCGKPAG